MLQVSALSKASYPSEPQDTQYAGVTYYCQYSQITNLFHTYIDGQIAEVRAVEEALRQRSAPHVPRYLPTTRQFQIPHSKLL